MAATLLSDSRVAPSRDVRDVLALTRAGLDDARGIHEDLEPLRRQTLELVDLNLQRIAGTHRAGAVRGWSNHPDYAEIGRIRANLDLIANASRSRQGGDVVETLSW